MQTTQTILTTTHQLTQLTTASTGSPSYDAFQARKAAEQAQRNPKYDGEDAIIGGLLFITIVLWLLPALIAIGRNALNRYLILAVSIAAVVGTFLIGHAFKHQTNLPMFFLLAVWLGVLIWACVSPKEEPKRSGRKPNRRRRR